MAVDLRTTAGAVPIERDVVLVSGPEAVAFLQGQLSQDVEALAIGASAPSLLLQPTGKVTAWVRATRVDDDVVELDLEAGFGDVVVDRLQRFKLRTKADIDLLTRQGWAARGPGTSGIGRPAHWPGVEGGDVLGPDPFEIPPADRADLEALRIECGVPAMGAELTDATIPAEAGQWLVDASVSFTKGCYTGQELVARIDSRGGNVPRPIRGLLLEAGDPPVGAPVALAEGGEDVGVLSSVARSSALGAIALAPLPRSVGVGVALVVADAPARVTDLPMR